MEQNLIKMAKEKEQADKRLLFMEIFMTALVSILFLALIFVASFISMPDWLRIILIVTGSVPFAIGIGYAIRIEQVSDFQWA